MGKFKFGKNSKKKLYGYDSKPGVHEVVQKLAEKALEYSTVDFSIIDGYRTVEDQKKMYREGRSELDGVNKISDHQRGLAIDILPYVKINNKKLNMYNVEDETVVKYWLEVYRAFMRAAMKLGVVLEFGLSYNIGGGRDWPHISIKGNVPKKYSNLDKEYLKLIKS